MSETDSGIYHKSVQGGKWILIGNLFQKVLTLVTFFILARLLKPEDYGIMAVVFMVVGFFEAMTTTGFEKALMQRSGLAEEYLDTVWTFTLAKSFIITISIIIAGPWIADFFHISGAVSVIQAGAFLVFIAGLSNSRQFYFFKNLDFKKVFLRDAVSQIVYMTVALGYAFFVEVSVVALLAGHLARYTAAVFMSYALYPKAPRFSFAFRRLKDLINYSRWVAGQNIFNYILGILDSVYVGRFVDASALGAYAKARDLAYAPVSPFTTIINRVGFPAYASLQEKLEKIQEGFLKTLDVILAIAVPVAFVFLAEGGTIISVLLGPAWLAIVVPLKILAVATLLGSIVTLIKPIFDALGRPDINFKLVGTQLISSLIFVYVGVKLYGTNGVAWAMLASWLLTTAYALIEIRPILRLGWDRLRETVMPVVGAVLIVSLVAAPWYLTGLGDIENPWLIALWLFGLGIIYVFAVWFFGGRHASGPRHTLFSIIAEIRTKNSD